MGKKTELHRDTASKIASVLDVTLFERRNSCNPKWNAQSNLSGRTHYVDDSTLKAFYSRILSTRDIEHGLIFMIVESVAADYQNRSRGFRFVAFDITGTVVNDRASAVDSLERTSAKAEKLMWEWADSFDTLAHYKQLLTYRADRMKQNAQAMAQAAKALKL